MGWGVGFENEPDRDIPHQIFGVNIPAKKWPFVIIFLLFCLLMFLRGHVCEAMTFSDLCL